MIEGIYIIHYSDLEKVTALADCLRSHGIPVDFDPVKKSHKNQMKQAKRSGLRFVFIMSTENTC